MSKYACHMTRVSTWTLQINASFRFEKHGWRHLAKSDIANAELVASSMLHPLLPSGFYRIKLPRQMIWRKPQAVCSGCKRSLMTKPLMLPRYALANDLCMGSCPKALLNLREGTQKLPPMVRACVQVTMLQPSPDGCGGNTERFDWQPYPSATSLAFENFCSQSSAIRGKCSLCHVTHWQTWESNPGKVCGWWLSI